MASTSAIDIAPGAGSYAIDPARSTIAFTVKHLFGMGTARGAFGMRGGAIRVGQSPGDSHAEAVIDAGSFHTNNARRDKDVLSAKYLDAATYPDIRFSADRIREFAEGSWMVSGSLAVKGTVGPAELHVDRITVAGNDVTFHATTELDRYAFGMTSGKGMAGRTLQLDLTVVASRNESDGRA